VTSNEPAAAHRWRFFRYGGFDQVAIDNGDDLRHLAELDPKLWTALSCPVNGLEFDARTLALIDTDGDSQIRVPEILAAVGWTCHVLKDPQVMFADGELDVADIDDSHVEGASLKAASIKLLGILGKAADSTLAVEDFAEMARLFPPNEFNGDGVIPAALAADEATAQVIGEIVATQGGVADRSGDAGVTAETLGSFQAQLESVLDWRARSADGADLILPLGEDTATAAEIVATVQSKVDDYFARCRLAAFDPRAADALNPPTTAYAALGEHQIDVGDVEISSLPLAGVAPSQALPLTEGLNPAWSVPIARLHDEVIEPLFGAREALALEEWTAISAKFAAFRDWMKGRPETALHELEPAYLAQIRSDGTFERLAALIEQDLNADASAAKIDAVERLVRYRRDLVTLLRNFVTLSDFYGGAHKAIFQAGTLYLDQRSCELVLRVADMNKHAALAPFSGCYLVYCSCTRAGSEPLSIVAALTGGEVDELMVPGRNGIFYDRQGRDWKASVVKVVDQPVSIRQAFWAPYRRTAALIESQIRKFAASRDKDVENTTAAKVSGVAEQATPPQPFDIAKFAGIFAAIGLALGAIGAALAAAITGLFTLAWWQLPLAIAAILLLISTPSMLLAYMTLRRRNLGPLLDANGWAVNARARINVPFGGALTALPSLPAGSSRSLSDPFAEKSRPWKTWLFLFLLAVVVVVLWQQGVLDRWVSSRF
jgi:hypothetical protein